MIALKKKWALTDSDHDPLLVGADALKTNWAKRPKYGNHFDDEWALTDSNRRPSACKADALNQLS